MPCKNIRYKNMKLFISNFGEALHKCFLFYVLYCFYAEITRWKEITLTFMLYEIVSYKTVL